MTTQLLGISTGYFATTRKIFHKTQLAIGATMIRLLLVEDQPSVRKGLKMLLAAEADFSVIGEATGGQAALDLTAALRPDVVLMDVDMPSLDQIATASTLRLMCPQTSVIMLSFQDDAFTRQLAEQAGAAAFVAKSMPVGTLVTAIRQVSQMKCVLGRGG